MVKHAMWYDAYLIKSALALPGPAPLARASGMATRFNPYRGMGVLGAIGGGLYGAYKNISNAAPDESKIWAGLKGLAGGAALGGAAGAAGSYLGSGAGARIGAGMNRADPLGGALRGANVGLWAGGAIPAAAALRYAYGGSPELQQQ